LGKNNLFYNEERIQNYNDPPICGHLCVLILKEISEQHHYITPLTYGRIINDLGKNSKYNEYAISK